MSERRFQRSMVLTAAIVVFATVLTIVGIRAEMTRDEVHRQNSACARAAGPKATDADRVECEQIRREARLTEPLEDTCIIQRKTLRSGWYERITRCPPVRGR